MRNLKKFLALVMAMVMAFSLMLTVNAANPVKTFDDAGNITPEFVEAADVLTGMKVFQGDEGGFRPGDSITRAEVAALIYRLTTGDTGTEKMDLYTTTHPFTDVAAGDWFAGYVGYCWNAGYIKGTTATTFNPYDSVTGYETLAMVLRAMGYDANGEFTGNNWIVNVSATATQRGLLDDVKTTHYANTLHLASRRDVVASILFQAAQKTRVKYTPAFGYQSGDFTGNNPADNANYNEYTPLGRLNFGLTSGGTDKPEGYRVVVGNQMTGEKYTLLAATGKTEYDSNGTKKSVDHAYAYPGSEIASDKGTGANEKVYAPAGLKLNGKTGLDLFGHKVTVWYDDRDANADGVKDQIYAYFDRATLAATVQSYKAGGEADGNGIDGINLSNVDKSKALLGIAAQKAGFKVDLGTDGSEAHTSNAFDRITNATAVKADAPTSPTRADKFGMYALISNNDKKTVDVVITLNPQVARIVQKDTVSTTKTLTLGNSTFTYLTAQGTASSPAGVIAMDQIIDGSDTTLGDKVAAWQVIGTNNKWKWATNAAEDTPVGKNVPATYFLEKLDKKTTGTVATYNGDGTITFTDGTKVERSWLYYQIKSGFTTPSTFEAGKTYTLALDNNGRWLGVTEEESKFVYATFGDYEIGGLGTGTIKYTVTGIDWDGNKVVNSEIKSIKIGEDPTGTYNYNVLAANYKTYPDADAPTPTVLAQGYNLLPFTKKDQGTVDSIGNRIAAGKNTGTMLGSDGTLAVSTLVDGKHNIDGERISTLSSSNDLQVANWTVTEQDVKNGFVDVYKGYGRAGQVLLTNDTKFIVVSGTGTATLDAKVYDGLAAFLGDNQSVSLETHVDAANGDKALYKHISYIKTDIDEFNRVDGQPATGDNRKVTHIIMSEEDLTYTNYNSLYFAADNTPAAGTGVKLAGAKNTVNQYELWNNGEKGYYFVDTDPAVSAANPYTTGTGAATTGKFLQLSPAYEVNGITVYRAKDVTHGNSTTQYAVGDVDLKFWYVGNNNLSTATVEKEGGSYKEVLNVTGAKVVDVHYNSVTCGHDEINSMAQLNAIVSGDTGTYNGAIKVAVAHDGVNASVIYVISVPTD